MGVRVLWGMSPQGEFGAERLGDAVPGGTVDVVPLQHRMYVRRSASGLGVGALSTSQT